MKREEWEFEYTASKIGDAAAAKRAFHQERVAVWKAKKAEVIAKIKESGIEVHEGIADEMSNMSAAYSNVHTRSSFGPQVVIDPMMQRDLAECQGKIHTHEALVKSFDGWVQICQANPEIRLRLQQDDWLHFFSKPVVQGVEA